jgi:hypothetical protein
VVGAGDDPGHTPPPDLLHELALLFDVRRVRPPVQVGEAGLAHGLVDGEPPPPLHVAAGRGLRRNLHALADQRPRHRPVEVEAPAHGARRRQQLVGLGEIERRVHAGRR